MVNRVDGVILSVGVVVLAASVVGVILYDEQNPESYTLSWSESEAVTVGEASDSGGPTEYSFTTEVTQEALSRTEFEVEVSVDGTNVNDDNVEVEVATPGDRSKTCSFTLPGGQTSSTDSCSVETGLNPRPSVTTVTALNVTDARREAFAQANLTNGTGNWTTTVTVDGGGQEIMDPSYEVTLTPTVYTWQVTPTVPGPSGQAG